MALDPPREHPSCYHCGQPCETDTIRYNNKDFCCLGCKQVFCILRDNQLDGFYKVQAKSGISQQAKTSVYFDYLDSEEIQSKLVELETPDSKTLSFSIPQIHCSACIWVLERLSKLHEAIITSRVNFSKKTCTITYNPDKIALSEVATILDNIGYTPSINLKNYDQGRANYDKSILYKIGVAGFCFGNIMLVSFPEYLSSDTYHFKYLFGYFKVLLIIPVIFYAGIDYIKAGWRFLKSRQVDIDLPIFIGIAALFFRSFFEILSKTGEGYLDSLAGFVFMLLLGKWFQNRTYANMSFDLDYKSFFPISISRLKNNQWIPSPIDKIDVGDHILVRVNEIIPCDGMVLKGNGSIDYSFVTGESIPIPSKTSEKVFAGGKVVKGYIEIQVLKSIKQSRLTQLWNETAFQKKEEVKEQYIIDTISKYFVYIIVSIAFIGLLYWYSYDVEIALRVFTSVLIIACPCVLALSIPFIYGNAVLHLSRHGVFLKNTNVLFRAQELDTVVFDKTGTLTNPKKMEVEYKGVALSEQEITGIASLAHLSMHPKSRAIYSYESPKIANIIACEDFDEFVGEGIVGNIEGAIIKIGSKKFVDCDHLGHDTKSVSYVSINGIYKGAYLFNQEIRIGVGPMLETIQTEYQIGLLSGDPIAQKNITALFNTSGFYHYDQSPQDKLFFIEELKKKGKKVMMVGDGLNDAGALKASQVGVVLSSTNNHFTPAADIVLEEQLMPHLHRIMRHLRTFKKLLYVSFTFAILYNGVGLYYALQGTLSPIVAAILMPISSLTIVLFGFISSALVSRSFWANQPKILQNDDKYDNSHMNK